MRRITPTFAVLLTTAALLGAAVGCEGCELLDRGPSPWKFSSDEADYELVFSGEWTAEPPQSINPHADVAASRDGQMYFMVIPQQLPSFPDPDVFDLKDAALEMLDESVDDLVIQRQGPVEIDGVEGMSVIATGEVEGRPTRYVTCYVIHDETGYQVISFAREQHGSELFEEVDDLLARWQFTDSEDAPDDEQTVPDDLPETAPGEGPLGAGADSSEDESD